MVAMPDKYRFNKEGLGKKLLRDIIKKSLGKSQIFMNVKPRSSPAWAVHECTWPRD